MTRQYSIENESFLDLLDLDVKLVERLLDEFAHRVGLAGGQNKVLWDTCLLQHSPHSLDVVASCYRPLALRKPCKLRTRNLPWPQSR